MPKTTKPIKRLTKGSDRVLWGVLGGIAEYTGTDPVVVRIIFIAVSAFTGFVPGVVAYLLAALIIPEPKRTG